MHPGRQFFLGRVNGCRAAQREDHGVSALNSPHLCKGSRLPARRDANPPVLCPCRGEPGAHGDRPHLQGRPQIQRVGQGEDECPGWDVLGRSDLGVQALVGQRSKAGGWSRGLTAAFGGGMWRMRLDGLEHLPGAQPHGASPTAGSPSCAGPSYAGTLFLTLGISSCSERSRCLADRFKVFKPLLEREGWRSEETLKSGHVGPLWILIGCWCPCAGQRLDVWGPARPEVGCLVPESQGSKASPGRWLWAPSGPWRLRVSPHWSLEPGLAVRLPS